MEDLVICSIGVLQVLVWIVPFCRLGFALGLQAFCVVELELALVSVLLLSCLIELGQPLVLLELARTVNGEKLMAWHSSLRIYRSSNPW